MTAENSITKPKIVPRKKLSQELIESILEEIAHRAYDASKLCTELVADPPGDVSVQAAMVCGIKGLADQIGCIADHYQTGIKMKGGAAEWMIPPGLAEQEAGNE